MNFLLLFITIVVIASIIPILKSSLRWGAILVFGIFSGTAAGIALLLDYLTPLQYFTWVGDQTATGLPLYLPGRTTSILGTGYGFFVIALCWGIALIAVALIKRSKKVAAEKAAKKPVEEPNEISEEQRIRKELEKVVESLQNSFDDPKSAGKEDALRDGGPFPQQLDKEPLVGGYEARIRTRFESLGDTFAQTTVADLKTNISNALRGLEEIKNDIVAQPYKELVTAKYEQNNMAKTKNAIQRSQEELSKTAQNRNAFIDSLKLRPAELPHWADDDKTSGKDLIVWGCVFALLEFIMSWLFLKDDIGAEAINIAGLAVFIIAILASFAGFLFQFMRRNQPLGTRSLMTLLYLAVGVFIFISLGLLLNYREFANNVGTDAISAISAGIDAITNGYISLISNVSNLTVFLINILALAMIYWKMLHFCDKFRGYSQVDKPFNRAEKQWDSTLEGVQKQITTALDAADKEANANSEKAKKYFTDIHGKTAALKNIKAIISSAYASILHQAYSDDVTTYRDNNCKKRVLKANPAPAYFNRGCPFCDVEQHFTNIGDTESFFAKNQEEPNQALTQAQNNKDHISAGLTQWKKDRAALCHESKLAFDNIINSARVGAAANSQ